LSGYSLSKLAESDLAEMIDYTVDRWGKDQALLYFDELVQCFQLITSTPGAGRSCNRLLKGIRRMEHAKHVIFYLRQGSSIFIVRILHQQRLPERHEFMEP
jgi:toxin ParE1/3/4